jgi:diguanylate cyclase (GGDEF)-like protein
MNIPRAHPSRRRTATHAWRYALTGALLAAGAPAGLLVLRQVVAAEPLGQELSSNWTTYVYVFLSNGIVLMIAGLLLGRRVDSLEALSVTDPLTGLLNRRAFRRRLADELDRSLRYGSPVSLMLVDVDGLKGLNDIQGHAMGDRAIQSVATAISRGLRASDFGARWGGDEFAIVTPNAARPAAWRSAQRLLSEVHAPSAEGVVPVSISIGLATFDPARDGAAGAEAVIKAADDALYMAKAAGGSRARAAEHMAKLPEEPRVDDAGRRVANG